MGIITAVRVAFFWVVNASRNEKSCLQFLIPTAVFHTYSTHWWLVNVARLLFIGDLIRIKNGQGDGKGSKIFQELFDRFKLF